MVRDAQGSAWEVEDAPWCLWVGLMCLTSDYKTTGEHLGRAQQSPWCLTELLGSLA